jgi:hypothetical protein
MVLKRVCDAKDIALKVLMVDTRKPGARWLNQNVTKVLALRIAWLDKD